MVEEGKEDAEAEEIENGNLIVIGATIPMDAFTVVRTVILREIVLIRNAKVAEKETEVVRGVEVMVAIEDEVIHLEVEVVLVEGEYVVFTLWHTSVVNKICFVVIDPPLYLIKTSQKTYEYDASLSEFLYRLISNCHS